MVDNLTESLRRSPWILWLMMAALGVAGESVERGGWLGRVSVACAAGTLAALLWPRTWWLQWVVAFVVLFIVGMLGLRRRGRGGATSIPPADEHDREGAA